MHSRIWAAVLCGITLFSATPGHGFFEAFSTLSEELKAIEQSSPEGLNDLLKKLQGNTGFEDVRVQDWFYRYVTSVARWGIAQGYKDANGKQTGTFGPGNTVTIAEVLKMALKAAQVDETTCPGAPRLPQAATHWARSFVICAEGKNMRLLRSSPDLNRAAKRGEVLSVIFDAFDDRVPPLLGSFKDTINHPLESDIAYAAALKMVSGDKDTAGKPKGTFRPDAPVNRAEAAKIIYERLRVEVMGERH